MPPESAAPRLLLLGRLGLVFVDVPGVGMPWQLPLASYHKETKRC